MSAVTSGVASGVVDTLSALLDFVKSPEYFERIKELRDAEDVARHAHDEAVKAKADADLKLKELADEQATHTRAVQDFKAEKAAHAAVVVRWQKVATAAQKAQRGED